LPNDEIKPPGDPSTAPEDIKPPVADPELSEAARLFSAALWRAFNRLMISGAALSGKAFAKATSAGKHAARQADRGRRKLAIRHKRRKAGRAEHAENQPVVEDRIMQKNPQTSRPIFHGVRSVLSIRKIAISLGAIVSLGLIAVIITAFATLPDLDDIRPGAENRLVFEDTNGDPLIARGSVPSDYAAAERIPDALRNAVVAVEDQRFFDHGGLDYRAILRAAWRNMRAGEVVEGGSTLTQQLVKITYLEPDRTFQRKLHEAVLTRQLERRSSKDEILTRYLNSVYLGAGATGMPAAAQVYFGVDIANLTLAQSAALAAMIRAPSTVNPFSDLPRLRDRAMLVIDLMVNQHRIDTAAANAARAELTTMAPKRSNASYGSWFTDWVVREADGLSTGFDGVVILRTTLDPQIQTAAETALNTIMEQAGSPAEAALIAMTPSGQIVAMVGGRDYSKSQFNRATDALRSPGSTFKTFVYLTALSQGIAPMDRIDDAAIDIDGYRPENFEGRFRGKVSLAEAFARSLNAATVRLAMTVGLDRVVETARTLGIEAELSETPALALGASGVTLIDMVEAYAGIASGIIPVKGRGIEGISSGGDASLLSFRWPDPPSTEATQRLMAAREDMTRMLALVVSDGTGQAADMPGGAVGKTGTSQDFRDALFIGWNGSLVTGVWVGNDDNTPMDGVTGGQLPAQIWKTFMEAATTPAISGTEQVAAVPVPTGSTCNVSACQRSYRSFRASDCTFQPYRGRRKLCTR